MNQRFDLQSSTFDILIQFIEQLESVHGNYLEEISNVKKKFENVEISLVGFNNLFKKCLQESLKVHKSKIPEFITRKTKILKTGSRLLLEVQEKQGKDKVMEELEDLNLEFTNLLKNLFKELEILNLSQELLQEICDFDVPLEISSFNQKQLVQGGNQSKSGKKSMFKRISKVFTGLSGRKSFIHGSDMAQETSKTLSENLKEQNRQVDDEGYTIPKDSIYEGSDKKLQDSDEALEQESLKLHVKINDEPKKDQGLQDLDLVNAVSLLKVTLDKNPRSVQTVKETFSDFEKSQGFKEFSKSLNSGIINQEKTELEGSDPFVANDQNSKNTLTSDSGQVSDLDLELIQVDLALNQETNVLIDQGSVKKAVATGQVNLCIPDSWPRTKTINLEFHDPSIFEELIPLSDIITMSGDSRAEVNVSDVAQEILEIPILKFKLNQSCIDLPLQVIHTIWKKESESKSLMVLFNYRCLIEEIQDLRIEAFISSDDETEDIKTQSKPEGIWSQDGKSMLWEFSSPENVGKVLAKFDSSSRLSAGVINLSYWMVSNRSNISVNGQLLKRSMISYKCVCT